ncbi:MAG: hypothetical protein L0I76_29545 [Pseudonocardia sp.]|nr:hypothetical protein [Pseudonocardia sp.]
MIDAAAPAVRLLVAVVAHFDDHDWDLPERRYIAAGQQQTLAVDDEHLCVSLIGMTPGASDATTKGGGYPSKGASAAIVARAAYMLRLMRCVAVIDDDGCPPPAEQIHADGLRLLADPGRLLDAVYTWAAAEPHNLTVTIGQVDPVGPEGGMAGHLLAVTLAPVQAVPIGGP